MANMLASLGEGVPGTIMHRTVMERSSYAHAGVIYCTQITAKLVHLRLKVCLSQTAWECF